MTTLAYTPPRGSPADARARAHASTRPWLWVWGASDLEEDGGWHLVDRAKAWRKHIRVQPLSANQVALGRSHMCAFMRYVDPMYRRMWASDLTCDRITQVIRRMRGLTGCGTLGALHVRAPPQHFKTYLVSEHAPAYAAMQDPWSRCIGSGYSRSLSKRNIRVFSNIVGRSTYQQLSRVRVGRVVSLDDEGEETIARDEARAEMVRYMIDLPGGVEPGPGYYLSVSINSELTGWAYELGLIDDWVRGPQEAYNAVERAKLLGKAQSMFCTRRQENSVMIDSMTPWHPEDIGYKIEGLCADAGIDDEVLALPALAGRHEDGTPITLHPEDPREPGSGEILDAVRHTTKFYREQQALLGRYWAPLCMLQASEFGEELLSPVAWASYDPMDLRRGTAAVVRLILSVDTNGDAPGNKLGEVAETYAASATQKRKASWAHASLFAVVHFAGRRMLWKITQEAGPWSFGTMVDKVRGLIMRALRATAPLDLVIERKALGPALMSDLERGRVDLIKAVGGDKGWTVYDVRPCVDKGMRANACVPSIYAGLVCLPGADMIRPEHDRTPALSISTAIVAPTKAAWAVHPNPIPGAGDCVDADGQAIRHAIDHAYIDAVAMPV